MTRPAALAALLLLGFTGAAGGPGPALPLSAVGRVRLGAGDLVHVVVVARWCAPCEAEVLALGRAATSLPRGSYKLVLVGVTRRQSAAEFADWVRGLGFNGEAVYDQDGSLERALGTQALPWHVVVGPSGNVLAQGEAAPSMAQLQRWAAGAGAAPPAESR